jgi:predicted DNA-binding antitoxin AbrB/MazE fold protein
MMQVCEAIYENGLFRPVAPVEPDLREGQHVRLVVETDSPEDILRMAAAVYEGLSPEDVDGVERIALDRSAFFTKNTG